MPMTTSHESAARVLRMKPRRCGHQVYLTLAPSSLAISCARWFSSPSPARLENGRLLGSEQTRSSCLGLDALHPSRTRLMRARQALDAYLFTTEARRTQGW